MSDRSVRLKLSFESDQSVAPARRNSRRPSEGTGQFSFKPLHERLFDPCSSQLNGRESSQQMDFCCGTSFSKSANFGDDVTVVAMSISDSITSLFAVITAARVFSRSLTGLTASLRRSSLLGQLISLILRRSFSGLLDPL